MLLALLGASITNAGRAETNIATNLAASAQAEAAANAAITAAAFHLLNAAPNDWQPDGKPHRIRIGDASVTVQAFDQRGEIDPNDATSGLLAALLRQLGVPDPNASSLGAAILDWRAATTAAPAPARAIAPPHEPFQSLDELGLIPGITPALLAKMQPHLTLYLDDTPVPTLADPIVQAAIADAVKRNTLSLTDSQDSGPLLARVTATAQLHASRFTRTALLRMVGQPYEILEWGQGN